MLKMGALAIAVGIITTATADDVYLKNGATLVGRVTYVDGKIYVHQANGIVILDKSKVLYVESKSTPLHEYEQQLRDLQTKSKATAEDYASLAQFALANGMKSQAEAMYKQVLSMNPDHMRAREALGFIQVGGKWFTPDEAAQAKGLVKHEGKWITPELKAELVRAESARAEVAAEKMKLEQKEKDLAIAEAALAMAQAEAEKAKAVQHRRRVHTDHTPAPGHR